MYPSMFILESEFLLNLKFSDARSISLWKIILFMNIILTQHISVLYSHIDPSMPVYFPTNSTLVSSIASEIIP